MAKLLRRRRQSGADEGPAPSDGPAASEGAGLLSCWEASEEAMMGVEDQCSPSEPLWADDGTVCARIFRWALSRLLSPERALERRAIGAGARDRLAAPLLLLLARMVEAEKAVAAGGHAPAARQRRRETIERLGRKRRVSFSTFDLSTVDTPDISKRGSDQHMDEVLQSLYLVLRAAEALRTALAAEGGSKAPGGHGKKERGKENEGHVTPPSAEEGEAAAGRKRRLPTRQALDKLVGLLEELQGIAATMGAEGAPLTLAGPEGEGLELLGDEPNWNEVANAASLYARELRLLCVAPADEMQQSRLLGRFSEVLSSLVRHELKRLLNLCSCGEEAQEVPAPAGDLGFGGKGGEREGSSLCASLMIHAETANLQYNSDDPAALLNFALQRLHANRSAWESLCAAAAASAAPTSEPHPHTTRLRSSSSVPMASEEHLEAKDNDGEDGEEAEDLEVSMALSGATEPKWWSTARELSAAALSYVGAVDFLMRVLSEDMVADAVAEGRFGRVERLTGMLKQVLGPIMSEDEEGLCVLSSIEGLMERLEAVIDSSVGLRESLLRSAPEGLLEHVAHGYGPTGAMLGAEAGARKKRKRGAKRAAVEVLEGPMAELLVWAKYSEIPPSLKYPEVSAGCIYSGNHFMEED